MKLIPRDPDALSEFIRALVRAVEQALGARRRSRSTSRTASSKVKAARAKRPGRLRMK